MGKENTEDGVNNAENKENKASDLKPRAKRRTQESKPVDQEQITIVDNRGSNRWKRNLGMGVAGVLMLVGSLLVAEKCRSVTTSGELGKTPTPTVEPGKMSSATAISTAKSEAKQKTELRADQFILTGFSDKVDATNVLTAKGADAYGNVFTNTIGLGTEMIFAEPGVLKVGPEFSQAEFTRLGKSVERYNPANQAVISTDEGSWSVREGGFTIINGNNMEIEVAGNDKTKSLGAVLGGDETNHWIVAIRGLFPDGKTPSDHNRTVKITNHPAGHTLVDSYPLGAYISQGQLKQIVENAHKGYPNSGDAGSPVVRILIFDLNTGAYTAVEQQGLDGTWKSLGRNW